MKRLISVLIVVLFLPLTISFADNNSDLKTLSDDQLLLFDKMLHEELDRRGIKLDSEEKAPYDIVPWEYYGVGEHLPKPVLISGDKLEYDYSVYYNLESKLYYEVTNATLEDYVNYKKALVAAGYISPSGLSEYPQAGYSGSNKEGYSVTTIYIGEGKGFVVSAKAPK